MEVINQLGYYRQTIKGLSQEQLAIKSKVSRHTISEIELGKRTPSLKSALMLAKALNCSVENIFNLK